MTSEAWLFTVLLGVFWAPAVWTLIKGDKKDMGEKKKNGEVIVVESKPDTRTTCPMCKVKAARPLVKTTSKLLNGKIHRWGLYKCGHGDCKQAFTRKLEDYK